MPSKAPSSSTSARCEPRPPANLARGKRRAAGRAVAPGRFLRARARAALAAALTATLVVALLLAAGCERSQGDADSPAGAAAPHSPSGAGDEAGPRQAAEKSSNSKNSGSPGFSAAAVAVSGPIITALGDSLTAGLGLDEEESYPSLLQEKLRAGGYPHRIVNAGVSGDTSAGGLSRMDWLLQQPVRIFILALGANDGLRGVPPEATRKNLAAIIERAQAAGAQVVLAGIRLPTNYGRDYLRRFEAIFPALAKEYELPFIALLLKDVAMRPALNQADGIHPNAEGTRIVAENVWHVLEPLLEKPLEPLLKPQPKK